MDPIYLSRIEIYRRTARSTTRVYLRTLPIIMTELCNIRLVSEKFREFIVWPRLSRSTRTGPRSAELGCRKAPVIVEGSLIDDYGGEYVKFHLPYMWRR